MLDLHCHILPGVDDGAPDLGCALEMARLAVGCGVTGLVASFHSNLPDLPNHWGDDLRRQLASFRRALKGAGIPLDVYAGMEIFGTAEAADLLRAKRLITLNGSRYPLMEFSFTGTGREATEILTETAAMGYRPIVAHPERYRYVQDDPTILNHWVSLGCLLQLNRGSLMGRFGRGAETVAFSLVDRGFAAAVASDAHSAQMRTPFLGDVWELLSQEFSHRTARQLLDEIPRLVLMNERIEMPEPKWF